MSGKHGFVGVPFAILVLTVTLRILASGIPGTQPSLVIDTTSSVAGFSQVFVRSGADPFTEERSVRADVAEGANQLTFPFSLIAGPTGDALRWDPANYPARFTVSRIGTTSWLGSSVIPLDSVHPSLDIVRFELQSSRELVVETGSYDGQVLVDVDLRPIAVQHEVMIWLTCLLVAVACVLVWRAVGQVGPWRRWMDGSDRLAGAFNPRDNALNLVRLVLAVLVIASHTDAIAGYEESHQLGFLGEGLVVDAFFGLSGFLMARTLARRASWATYLWHRVVRLFPAFLIGLVAVAFALAPIVHIVWPEHQPDPFTLTDGAVSYVWSNASLWLVQGGIAQGPQDVPVDGLWNGSIWTMGWTLWCDLGLAALAATGALTRRPWIPLLIAWGSWALLAWSHWNPETGLGAQWGVPLRFALLFSLGVCAYVLRNGIPMRWLFLLAAVLGVAASDVALDANYRVLAAPLLVYVVLWLACRVPLRVGSRNDLSYGIYLYGYPVQQVLVMAGFAAWGWWAFTAGAILLAVPVAAFSWFLVEKQGMRLRDWGPPASVDRAVSGIPGAAALIGGVLFIGYWAIWWKFVERA